MEERLCGRLVQVGIRTLTPHQREQITRFGVDTIEMQHFAGGARPAISGPVYLSIDLDGIDPAFAPGVSHREPGGLSVRDVLSMIHALDGPIVGADVVEFNPAQDLGGVTASVAAKITREIAGGILLQRWQSVALRLSQHSGSQSLSAATALIDLTDPSRLYAVAVRL